MRNQAALFFIIVALGSVVGCQDAIVESSYDVSVEITTESVTTGAELSLRETDNIQITNDGPSTEGEVSSSDTEATSTGYTSNMRDEVWNQIDLESCRFKSKEEFMAETEYYIQVISEFVGKENWYDVYKRGDNICPIEYTLGDSPQVLRSGHQVTVYLNKYSLEYNVAPIAHEIAHVIVPFGNRSLSLSEGLVSYCQDKFGKNWSEIYFEMDVHAYANSIRNFGNGVFEELLPNIGSQSGGWLGHRNEFYALSQSFSTYLIDYYGIEAYMDLYDSYELNGFYGNYDILYQKTFEQLKTEWLEHIETFPTMSEEELIDFSIERYREHGLEIPREAYE